MNSSLWKKNLVLSGAESYLHFYNNSSFQFYRYITDFYTYMYSVHIRENNIKILHWARHFIKSKLIHILRIKGKHYKIVIF
jgi:hypothetical protein